MKRIILIVFITLLIAGFNYKAYSDEMGRIIGVSFIWGQVEEINQGNGQEATIILKDKDGNKTSYLIDEETKILGCGIHEKATSVNLFL